MNSTMSTLAPAEPEVSHVPAIGDPHRVSTVVMIVGALIMLVGLAWFVIRPTQEPSSIAPAVALPSAVDGEGTVGLPVGEPAVVVFLGPFCDECELVTSAVFGLDSANRILVNSFVSPEPSLVSRSQQAGVDVGLDSDGQTAKRFGVTSYPTTVVIGDDGLIAAQYAGAIDPNQLVADLASASKAEKQP
jgi:hypothetical protein